MRSYVHVFMHTCIHALTRSCVHAAQLGDLAARSMAGNIIILTFSFLVLVLVTLYTASTGGRAGGRVGGLSEYFWAKKLSGVF